MPAKAELEHLEQFFLMDRIARARVYVDMGELFQPFQIAPDSKPGALRSLLGLLARPIASTDGERRRGGGRCLESLSPLPVNRPPPFIFNFMYSPGEMTHGNPR